MVTTIKTLVMNFVQNRGTVKRSEIIKYITELKGIEYDRNLHRGYFADAFAAEKYRNITNYPTSKKLTPVGYFMKPSPTEPRYLVQDKPYGPYHLAK